MSYTKIFFLCDFAFNHIHKFETFIIGKNKSIATKYLDLYLLLIGKSVLIGKTSDLVV
jgi:hypothetical protein